MERISYLCTQTKRMLHPTDMKSFLLFMFSVLLTADAYATDAPKKARQSSCRIVKIQVEQLPDLIVPRSGHATLCLNGEYVVFGGHTNGFVPTATAEYFKSGSWHLAQMVYEHDDALCVALKSGKVLLGGGHEQALGIGQTFSVEMYDPETHTFTGFGCLDQKRSLANGVEIDSGRVAIAGNWYADDGIEMFDGSKFFTHVKQTSVQRAYPYMLRIAENDAIVLGNLSTKGVHISDSLVDRLLGDPFTVPFLQTWKPLRFLYSFQCDASSIGDEERGDYSYLLPVSDKNGQMAIARVRSVAAPSGAVPVEFSILPTSSPIPMETKWGKIIYSTPVIVDKQSQLAYVCGFDMDHRFFVLCLEYGKAVGGAGAPMTLYYTDPLPADSFSKPVLTPDGNLLMAGGSLSDNFAPSNKVFLLRMSGSVAASSTSVGILPWVIALLVLAALVFLYLIFRHHRSKKASMPEQETETEKIEAGDGTGTNLAVDAQEQLMKQISRLMKEEQLFLKSELKVSDVAELLATNSRYVSDCIRANEGCSFIQYVNRFRVSHAKELLRRQPETKIASLCIQSGFANETSFFRTFKSFTGMTPREWLQKESEND